MALPVPEIIKMDRFDKIKDDMVVDTFEFLTVLRHWQKSQWQ